MLANLLLGFATALAATAALVWIAAPPSLTASWTLRLAVVGGLVIGAALILGWLLSRRLRNETVARQCLEALSRYDAAALAEETSSPTECRLAASDPWNLVYRRLKEQLVEQAKRLADAEHARARAEIRSQRLTTERKQLAEILSNLPDPVLAIDQYDELVLANTSAEQLLHFSSKNAEKRALDNLIHCEQLIELLRDARRRKSPATRTSELTLIDDAGQEHEFRVTCRSLTTDSGDLDRNAPHGAVAVLNDIGQLKAIQHRNAEFVSAVSHEMKAPLSGIKAYVELLSDGEAEDEATREEFLGVISSQADRLQRLVENLLNLARIEAGVVEVQKEARSLNELMEEALNVVQPAAEAKQIELSGDLSPMYLEVLADRDMILQSVINLLSNAVKYTRPSGRVTLRTRMEDNQVWFEVEDTGVGLGPEDCQRVFEKFYRVKKDSQMAQGTGLGLALAKHIVEDVHNGKLIVISELGKGSTFRAILPSAGCLATAKL
ncbi:MAG TPA: ATP-binding protein [Pirellulaceae bacterium]|nr:ATP-binding protein [Pirellulaceae bacterium]